MNAVLDIIIVCIIIVCAATGYKNGLVKTVMRFLSFIIAFFMAKIFSPELSSVIYTKWIQPNFIGKVTAQIESFLTKNINLDHLVKDANPPDNFVKMLESYGIKIPNVQEWINDAVAKGSENINEFVAEQIVEPAAKGISMFLAFTAILIAALILLKIITALISKAVELPGLKLINKTGGVLLGLVYGMLLVYIFIFLAENVLPFISANFSVGSADEIIEGTVFFKWLYTHSPINYIM